MNELSIKKNERLLILCPHPDDESIGTGGLISLFGPQCDIWLLTDGCLGGEKGQDERYVAQVREDEFNHAMQIANVNDVRMFGVRDRALTDNVDILLEEDFRPYQKVFITNASDSHPDHCAAFIALKKAFRNGSKAGLEADVFQYEVTAPLGHITHFLDISEKVDKKRELIGCYSSQLIQADYFDIALSLNSFRASVLGLRGRHFEVFYKSDIGVSDDPLAHECILLKSQLEKRDLMLACYDRWANNELCGKTVSSLISKVLGNKIWIYGCGLIGKTVSRALLNSGISIVGFIDKYVTMPECEGIPILKSEDISRSEKDVPVLVTAIYEYVEIRRELQKKGFGQIVSLNAII